MVYHEYAITMYFHTDDIYFISLFRYTEGSHWGFEYIPFSPEIILLGCLPSLPLSLCLTLFPFWTLGLVHS